MDEPANEAGSEGGQAVRLIKCQPKGVTGISTVPAGIDNIEVNRLLLTFKFGITKHLLLGKIIIQNNSNLQMISY